MSSSFETLLQKTRELVEMSQDQRQDLIGTLRSAFIAERISTNLKLESARRKAIEILESRLDSLTPYQVLKAIQALNEVAESDFATLVGSSQDKNKINIQNVLGVGVSSSSKTILEDKSNVEKMRSLSEVIEAIEIMQEEVAKIQR